MPESSATDRTRLNVPPIDSPFLERILGELDERDAARMRELAERGYIVVDLEMPDFERVAERIIAALAPRYPEVDRRVREAWYFNPDVRAIAAAPGVIELLRTLYQREPIPFQTLNFDSGTEQAAHSDTLHFHCAPGGFMCGVWVALEDVDEACGPLVVYPGSHRLPTFDMHDLGLNPENEAYSNYEERVAAILAEGGYEAEDVLLRKGQAVIWAANLFHGGKAIGQPGRTRHSQVTHYYFEDCLYYFPMESDPHVRRMCMREVIDLRSGEVVPHRHRGREVDLADYRFVMTYPRPLPDWVSARNPRSARVAERRVAEPGNERLLELEERLAFIRESVVTLREENRQLVEDNRQQRELLHELWSSVPFRIVHGFAKTWKTLRRKLGLGPRPR